MHDNDVEALILAKKYLPKAKPFVFHAGKKAFKIQNVWALPFAEGLKEIGL